jgi:diguanylate cyclase (GGDEF)-like protein
VPAAVFRADQDQRITFRNERWTQLVGVDPSIRYLRDIVDRDDRDRLDGELAALVEALGPASATVEVRSRDGARVYLVTCRAVSDLVNDRRSLVGAVTDISDTVALRERAEHDPLTGLHNRTAVEERLAEAMADEGRGTVVAFIDLDDFKHVNDTFGHAAGDRVLSVLAQRLRACVRPGDVVGRYGGDEFVLILRDAPVDDAGMAARLDDILTQPIRWEGRSWVPGVSIGVARPGPADDPAAVLRHADETMFASKRQRKLRLVGPDPASSDPRAADGIA